MSISPPVLFMLPCENTRWVAATCTPMPSCSPEGSWLASPTCAPGWRSVWYIRSWNTARPHLKPLVWTLARLLEMTSIDVCWPSRPVLATHNERIMMKTPGAALRRAR
ncbi:Uncharacterised protein [Bordetella pertussis]|nr:Uncharacterised protein [Bordetella pertussis]